MLSYPGGHAQSARALNLVTNVSSTTETTGDHWGPASLITALFISTSALV